MPRLVIGLWMLASFSDVFAAGLLSYGFLQHRRKGNRLDIIWGVALGAIAIESLCSLISLFLLPDYIEEAFAYALFRLLGRSVKAAALWLVVANTFITKPGGTRRG